MDLKSEEAHGSSEAHETQRKQFKVLTATKMFLMKSNNSKAIFDRMRVFSRSSEGMC